MANPRQRRKSRSSSYKPVSHSRHAKRTLKKTPLIRGPRVLQDAWDKHKTVKQNYVALGLVHTLNPSASGGVEPMESQNFNNDSSGVMQTESTSTAAPTSSQSVYGSSKIPRGFGRIIRNEAGNVLGIELPETEESQNQEKNMTQLTPDVDESILEKWVTDLGAGGCDKPVEDTRVVKALERISSAVRHDSATMSVAISGSGPRHASSGEIAYLKRLVDKYGQDAERMAKDRKLNPEQRTAGELRRGLRRAGLQ